MGWAMLQMPSNVSNPKTMWTTTSILCHHRWISWGSGTEEDPYVVCDAGTLQRVDLDLTAHYLQTTDIDVAETLFTPLAYFDFAAEIDEDEELLMGFVGQYDGDGFSIMGLTIDETSEEADSSMGSAALFRLWAPAEPLKIFTWMTSMFKAKRAAALVGN